MLVSKRPDLLEDFTAPDPQGGLPLFLADDDAETLLSLSLRKEQKLIWVTGVLGKGLKGLRHMKKFGLENGYEWIGFKVRIGSEAWGKGIVRYSKARLMVETSTGNEYCASLHSR